MRLLTLNAIERNTLLLVIVWTSLFGYSLWLSTEQEKANMHELAIKEINSNFDDVDTFRQWIAKQGGIYVPISEHIKPNPTIDYMPERDVTTTTGTKLTLINTPYLLKNLSETHPTSFRAHMSGIEPLNPANQADEWETKALRLFENKGLKEHCEVVDYRGEPHMRLIRPARFEARCLSCHFDKRYEDGDVLGGLSVSIPMQSYYQKLQLTINKLIMTHGGLWFLGLVGIGLVYREEKKNFIKRQKNENKLRRAGVAFNNMSEGLMVTDADMQIIAVNEALTEMTKLRQDEFLEMNLEQFKKYLLHENKTLDLPEILKEQTEWEGEIEFIKKNSPIPLYYRATPVLDEEGSLNNFIMVCSDIRERKHFEEKLAHLAQHDHLTDLPNRLLLNDRLEQAIIRAQRENKKIAILFLDLDNFKNINDSLGHHMGDEVLIQITQRLRKTIRKGDTLSRHGGDEFIIVMENIDSDENIVMLANKLIRCIKPEVNLNDQKYYLGVSIGISLYPEHSKQAADLISMADIAMYKAKQDGKNNFKFYTTELSNSFHDRVSIETELHNAIQNDEFVLHYQPQISILRDEIVGVECLLRWQHPKHGLIYPDNFIYTAEEVDLMSQIGEIVIDKACAQMNAWLKQGIDIGILAVNISGKQITNQNLNKQINRALEKYKLPSNCLELEVTENFIMNQAEQSIPSLEKLRESSVHISIDDFGTGYSLMNYLKKLPINKIKIDRSFVEGIPFDLHDKAIINAVITIGKSLNFKIVAEGVENSKQLEFLKEAGCDEYQGYYFSKALPADEFANFFLEKIALSENVNNPGSVAK